MTEAQIQKAVIKHVRQRGVSRLVYFHVPNGGRRGKKEARQLKNMGTQAGVSDLIFYHKKEFFALELKADDGRPTEPQLTFHSDVRHNGGHAVVAEGLSEALAILEAWQLIRPEAA